MKQTGYMRHMKTQPIRGEIIPYQIATLLASSGEIFSALKPPGQIPQMMVSICFAV
jgi:hypothetical protein